jgi:twitching motility protein PilT
MTEAQMATLDATGSVDFSFDELVDEGRLLLRVNLFRSERGLAAALRPIERRIPSLEELGLPASFRELIGFTSGLVLMTGQAGSGKSTTLAALIEQLNTTRPCHIITLEDPIEYRYTNARSLIHQREVGRHVESFSSGLRAALRESPDVILLGELRDLPTISAALTAAETGHLVLATLHCGSAPMAVDRIIDVFPGHQQQQIRSQLAAALRAVVTQTLLPAITPGQRVPAYEKLMVTDAVANKIRESRGHQLLTEIQTGRVEGMVSLERSLAALVQSGQVAIETALNAAHDRDGLKRLVKSGASKRAGSLV